MPKYRVVQRVDALAYFTCIVEADDAEEAEDIAENNHMLWEFDGVSCYDKDRSYDAEVIENPTKYHRFSLEDCIEIMESGIKHGDGLSAYDTKAIVDVLKGLVM